VLSQAEKRYVKLDLKRHTLGETNQSELLFDALAGQETYDEAALKRRFKGKGFVKRLPEAKRELMLMILRAMRQFHAERTERRRVYSAIVDAEFLRLRQQHRWARRRIDEALSEAEIIQSAPLLALAQTISDDIDQVQDRTPSPLTSPDTDASVIAAENLREAVWFERLSDRMQAVVAQYGRAGSIAASAIASDLVRMGEALFPIRTTAAQNHWLRVLSLKAFFIDNDPATALRYDRSRLDVLERDDAYRRANIAAWNNLVHSVALRMIGVQDLAGARVMLDRMRHHWDHETKRVSPHNRRAAMANVFNVEILLMLATMDVDQSGSRISELMKMVTTHDAEQLTEVGLVNWFNLGLIQVARSKYRDALSLLNRIDEYPPAMREETHTASRALRLILHFELEHDSVVTSMIRAERRRWKGLVIPSDIDLLLTTLASLQNAPPGKQQQELWRSLADHLSELPSSPPPITSIFDLRAWARAKAERRTWREVVLS
jgi:hypothetical protein